MVFQQNTQSAQQIRTHLIKVNESFFPPLDTYINIEEYAQKLFDKAINFEAIEEGVLIGLVAGYHNREENIFFISNVSVDPDFQGKGIAKNLFGSLHTYCHKNNIYQLKLQVFKKNLPAISLYQNLGFEVLTNEDERITLVKSEIKMKNPLVSISCITFNHAPYIRQCLDGFLMQQCDFDFEILIHDDASTDETQEIIKEYAVKYPEIIKPILQKENQYSKGRSISATYNWPRARGKYIALCEGDDYWTDPLKLQKQVDFLEANPEYSLVCGGFISKNEETGEEKVELKEVEASPDHTEKGFDITLERLLKQWLTKTLTLMYRKSALDLKEYQKYKYAKDFHLNYELLKKGKGYYMKEIFGVYHVHDGGIFSKLTQEMRHSIHFQVYGEVHRKNPSDELIKKKYYNVLRTIIKNEYSIKTPFRIYFEMYKISGSRKDFKKMVKAALGRN